MLESKVNLSEAEREIRDVQLSNDQSNLRRASELSMAEKLKLGVDLYHDGIRWIKKIIQAEQRNWSGQQVSEELDRRKAINRRIEEQGLFQTHEEGR